VWKSRVGEREEMGENDRQCQISWGWGHQELPNATPHATKMAWRLSTRTNKFF